MKRVAILSCVNIRHMSLISLYTDILKECNVSYDIIYMDKYDEDEEFECAHKYRYTNVVKKNLPKIVKKIKYMMFYPFATKILNREKYDFVIVWNDVAIFMFADYLAKHYKGRYCLNVRDNMYYDKKIFKKRYERCFANALFNTTSSNGYLRFLPKNAEYFQVHSLNLSVLKGMNIHDRMRTVDEPIRIGFIGYVRFFERNKRIIDVFGNDLRFELHYYGTNAKILMEYAKSMNIQNGVFHDTFPVKDTGKYLEQIDILNNLYGNDTLNVRLALSIKFYHALYAKIPILVHPNTYVGECATNVGIGFYVESIDNEMKERLYYWYHSLDFQVLSSACDLKLQEVNFDNKIFKEKVISSICTSL